MAPNSYSAAWFDLFMPTISPEQTAREIAFLTRQLPLPAYAQVLDLCCGWGRHSLALAECGYTITGVDRDPEAIAVARRRAQASGVAVMLLTQDMRQIGELPESYHAIINMWQSLSYFDDAENTTLLRAIRQKLLPSGRFVVDMYHRGFFEAHQGKMEREVQGVVVATTQRITDNRLRVELTYSSGGADVFEWQMYTPEEFIALADACGFTCRLACASFDEATAPTADNPRMQFIFERR